jgi:superfamily II DNA or RNA helicase
MAQSTKYKDKIVNNKDRSEAIAQFAMDKIKGEEQWPAIIFVREQAHARALSEICTKILGTHVPYVSSTVHASQRKKLAERMRDSDKELPLVVSCPVWGTGIDIPPATWGMWAGSGQAPVGLKQAAGRFTRLSDDKEGYTFYDWQDVGSGCESYEKHSEKRMEHYRKGGFAVDSFRPTEKMEDDAKLLLKLLEDADAWGGARYKDNLVAAVEQEEIAGELLREEHEIQPGVEHDMLNSMPVLPFAVIMVPIIITIIMLLLKLAGCPIE